MSLTNEQIARVQKNIPLWVDLMKKNNVKSFIIPFGIAQIINETGWFGNKSYNVDRNPGGVTWNSNYVTFASQRPGTSKGSLRPANEGGNYVHYDSWDNSAKDWIRVLNRDTGLGKPLDAANIDQYVARLIKNGYMANSQGYLKNMKGILNLLTPHVDIATLIKKKTRYSSYIDRIYAALFGG